MTTKTAVITIAIFGVLVIVAAYIQRKEFVFGIEWFLPFVAAAVVPLREKEKEQ